MLELDHVSKVYDGVCVVDQVQLRFQSNRTYVLIGPSGSGKSTILRMLIGLVTPDRGQVLWNSRPLSELDVLSVRRRLGYVIQQGGLFPHLTARQNIALPATYLRHSAGEIQSRISELARLTQFPTDALSRFPEQLSGGQRQRVSLMRALMLDPEILLFDEPLSALDPMIRSDLQQQLMSIFADLKKTVVLVTHDLNEAAYLGDEIILLKSGRIVQTGSIEALLNQPSDPFVSAFVRAQTSHLVGEKRDFR